MPQASAEFVCAMEEVLEEYERPYSKKYPVVCLDESPHQLVGEQRKSFIDRKGVKRVDYQYQRQGVADIFMICEPKAGKRFIEIRDNHNHQQWASIVAYIAEDLYKSAGHITLIEDNLKTHRKAALYRVFDPQRARAILNRIRFVHTPTHGSWLNAAEIELSVLNRVVLKQRIGSKEELLEKIKAYEKEKNKKAAAVNWQFTTKDARVKLKQLYPKV